MVEEYIATVVDVEPERAEVSIVDDQIVATEKEENITVTASEPEEITVSEIFSSPDSFDALNHAHLYNREAADQHPITAITGLKGELDDIKALKTVYSDTRGFADYYEWYQGQYDESGYFVSVVPHTSKIQVCDGKDVFGVTISESGFVGGQNKIVRDNHYGLVATSGIVKVRCESDVEEGDYIIPNARGYARKSNVKYGYKVLAMVTLDGVEYAVIALGTQADVINNLGVDLSALQSQTIANERNIVSAINVANQAYNKSSEATSASEKAVEKATQAGEKADNAVESLGEINQTLETTNATAAQARAIAESVALSATTIGKTAIDRANDAWAKADEVATETQSLCAKIDQHSIGEYSQAYGLTFEQAQNILVPGMLYAPTILHTEKYEYDNDAKTTEGYERTFTPDFLYQWGYIPALQGYGWVTVDKYYTIQHYEAGNEPNDASKAVYFSYQEPAIADNSDFGYWYAWSPNGEPILNKEGKASDYIAGTLYKWEKDHWVAVATLEGNSSNRMVSEVYQTTNEITMGVMNARGCIAALDARVTDTEASTQQFSEWKKGEESKMASVRTIANDDSAAVVISALKKDGGEIKEMANLTLSVADAPDGETVSGLVISADNIDFKAENYSIDASKILLNGTTSFIAGEGDETKIDGGKIKTGTITADKIDVNELSAISANLGTVTTGKIQSPNYDNNIGFKISCDDENMIDSKYFKVTQDGEVTATNGEIASWHINDRALYANGTGMCSIGNEKPQESQGLAITDGVVTGIGTCTDNHIIIPYGITSIGDMAFCEQSSLTSVEMPDSVTSIGESAFGRCDGLTSIVIPDSVTKIGNFAFSECYNLTSVVIGGSVTSIGSSAFRDCNNLTNVYYGGTEEEWDAIQGIENGYIPANATIHYNTGVHPFPSLVGEQSYPCFYAGCDNIGPNGTPTPSSNPKFIVLADGSLYASAARIEGTVYINDGEIGGFTLKDGNLTSQYEAVVDDIVVGNNASVASPLRYVECTHGGVSGYAVCTKEADVWGGYTETEIIIPDEYNGKPVLRIDEYAFYNCSQLTKVIIGNNVRRIGKYAFRTCSSLTNITIPDSVDDIQESAFAYSGIQNIDFGPHSRLQIIGPYAFDRCDKLTKIELHDVVRVICDGAFRHCTALQQIILGTNIAPGTVELSDRVSATYPYGIYTKAFYGCPESIKICYKGTYNDWVNNQLGEPTGYIRLGTTTTLTDSNFYYYDEGRTQSGNYWHYNRPDGICISGKDKLIDTKYFTLDADGIITAEKANIKGEISAETVSAKCIMVSDADKTTYMGITADIPYYKDATTSGVLKFINGLLVEYT